MDHTFLSALILLLLVLDPLGSLPIFISVMRAVPKDRRTFVAVREIGLPPGDIPLALLAFNLGVALLFLPFTGWMGRRFAPPGEPTPSALNAPV